MLVSFLLIFLFRLFLPLLSFSASLGDPCKTLGGAPMGWSPMATGRLPWQRARPGFVLVGLAGGEQAPGAAAAEGNCAGGKPFLAGLVVAFGGGGV